MGREALSFGVVKACRFHLWDQVVKRGRQATLAGFSRTCKLACVLFAVCAMMGVVTCVLVLNVIYEALKSLSLGGDAARIRRIRQKLSRYARDHKGLYPASLKAMQEEGYLSAEDMNYLAGHRVTYNPPPAKAGAWLSRHPLLVFDSQDHGVEFV
jgi:hypothetical protein